MTLRHRRVMQVAAGGAVTWRSDDVSTEEPLEIRIGDVSLSVTMRTPGEDFDLVAGFLITEGVVRSASEIAGMRMCPDAAAETGELNIVEVHAVRPRDDLRRHAPRFLHDLVVRHVRQGEHRSRPHQVRYDVAGDPLRSRPRSSSAFPPSALGAATVLTTGGLHAAALFDAEGSLLCLREDVGRHNAFDKVIGWAATQGLLPLRSHIILASGRASFE